MKKHLIELVLIKMNISPFLFWGYYTEFMEIEIESKRGFILNDAMQIKGVYGGIIENGYLIVNNKYKISLKHKKEIIIKKIEKWLCLTFNL